VIATVAVGTDRRPRRGCGARPRRALRREGRSSALIARPTTRACAASRATRRPLKISPTEDVDAILRDTEKKADERAELL
jgi:hypothetical protein